MFTAHMERALDRRDLEKMLSTILVPVEPSDIFIHRLKARLINYRGGQVFSGWVVVGVIAMAVLVVLSWLGLLLRLVLLFFGLFRIFERRKAKNELSTITISGE